MQHRSARARYCRTPSAQQLHQQARKPQIRQVGASLGMKRATSSRAASVSVPPARRRALRCRSACPRAGSERPAEYAWQMPTTLAT